MKIGIIGAGEIGGTLARRFTALGHQVSVANSRGPESLAELAAENIPKLPRDLFAATPDTVVIVDTGNYYPQQRDGRIEAIEAGTTESRWVAQQLNRPVIKAFNNIQAQHLLEFGQPKGTPGRIALPVAGDDQEAKIVILQLVDELGFDGVDAGTLDESWRQQPDTPVYGTNLDAEGVRRGLSAASRERKPEWRAA
jgi:predicted dinucleotide-binding enzyme